MDRVLLDATVRTLRTYPRVCMCVSEVTFNVQWSSKCLSGRTDQPVTESSGVRSQRGSVGAGRQGVQWHP